MDRYLAQISVMILYVSMKLSEKAFIYYEYGNSIKSFTYQD